MNNHVLRRSTSSVVKSAIALVFATAVLPAMATSLEQAKRIHDRLAGVPPSSAVLTGMQAKIDANNAIGAAYDAMNNPAFYNATLKNWATPWTNRDGNKFAPLNDYTATVIGIVRDGATVDYRQVLFGDIIYVPNPATYGAYSNSSNASYLALESADGDMGNSSVLQKQTQSSVTSLAASATAGVVTTRAAARAFFIDGTNRAMFRFTLKNHLCNDMEQVQDVTRPSDRIRQDVSRSPGGDSRLFMNGCVGCHSGMDPMAQAFAYYNFSYTGAGNEDSGQLVYTPGAVQPKYLINDTHFKEGYVTPNDHWDNYWRDGPNTAIFGWSNTHTVDLGNARNKNGIYGGVGAKSMLEELANSEAFAVCSVKKVFKAVCLRDPSESDRTTTVHGIAGFNQMLTDLKSSNYNLKQTFAQAAVYCSGN
ncbi:MAG: hypothetical protein QM709_06690 [Spongiibacteraceae bacterium]